MTKEDFRNGIMVLMLIHRKKEGGNDRANKNIYKRISTNEEEFELMKNELIEIKNNNKDIPYRLYATVNDRDINKAIRIFKQEMLDADYYDEESRNSFYIDIKNRWFSCLMKPQASAGKAFLIDVDRNEGGDLFFV